MSNVDIRIVYDNSSVRRDLSADWGFSALVRTRTRNILFDAGADGEILMKNLQRLKIDPAGIDTVFISHHHFDHTGGLAAFLHANSAVEVFVPQSLRGIRRAQKVFHLDTEYQIDEDIYATGELKGIEQSLFIHTPAGFILIVGCSHPGLENILPVVEKHGHVHALVGGFHGFSDYKILKEIDYICPTHCTRHIREISEYYPGKILNGGVGTLLTFPGNTELKT
jgi:7,8-dihydropterin-6-yl-methyl-4-(beta-D-ribofuranosyl)aminobenzene 5'-phosphate synthase